MTSKIIDARIIKKYENLLLGLNVKFKTVIDYCNDFNSSIEDILREHQMVSIGSRLYSKTETIAHYYKKYPEKIQKKKPSEVDMRLLKIKETQVQQLMELEEIHELERLELEEEQAKKTRNLIASQEEELLIAAQEIAISVIHSVINNHQNLGLTPFKWIEALKTVTNDVEKLTKASNNSNSNSNSNNNSKKNDDNFKKIESNFDEKSKTLNLTIGDTFYEIKGLVKSGLNI